jgi:DNA-binding transcriptional LysR family regulator
MLLMPHLHDFARAYPSVALDIIVEDRFVDIVAERYDAGLRLGERLQPDMVAVRIGAPQRFTIVATPEYLRRRGRPATIDALAEHCCIQRRFASGTNYAWEIMRDGAEIALTDMVAALTSNDDGLLRQAVLSGVGIGFLYEQRIKDDIEAGRLVELFPEHCLPFTGFFLYHPSRRQVRPALRAFIDFFVAANRDTG